MLSALKKVINVSGCEITIETEFPEFRQGDYIFCKVQIVGGEYEQHAKSITVSLEEAFWESRRDYGRRDYGGTSGQSRLERRKIESKIVASDLLIKTGETHNFRYSGKLTQNCCLSDLEGYEDLRGYDKNNLKHTAGWLLIVSVDVPKAKDPEQRVKIQVNLCKEVSVILYALKQEMGFIPAFLVGLVNKGDPHSTYNLNGRRDNEFRFNPPQRLKPHLDFLDLELVMRSDKTVQCKLVFDKSTEKSVGGFFKSLVNEDKARKHVTFSKEDLFDENGEPRHPHIAATIDKEIQAVITGS